jgi:hypothetical protein
MTPSNRHLADKLGDIWLEIAALEERAALVLDVILATSAATSPEFTGNTSQKMRT